MFRITSEEEIRKNEDIIRNLELLKQTKVVNQIYPSTLNFEKDPKRDKEKYIKNNNQENLNFDEILEKELVMIKTK